MPIASQAPVRILGIDPGLQRTGWGVVSADGPRVSWLAHGVIATGADMPLVERLGRICAGLGEAIGTHAPDEAAVEEVFLARNARSALLLGHARGAALSALALSGMPVAEYGARHIKKALTGTGAAEKEQVAFMVRRLLPAAGVVPADAADALAAALCHAVERRTPVAALAGAGVRR